MHRTIHEQHHIINTRAHYAMCWCGYVFTYTFSCLNIHTNTYIHTYIHTYMHTYTSTHTCKHTTCYVTYLYVHIYSCIYTRKFPTRIHNFMYIICTYAIHSSYTSTYIYIYIYVVHITCKSPTYLLELRGHGIADPLLLSLLDSLLLLP